MKSLFPFIVLIVFSLNLQAQKVGVNKTFPEYTLDVRSSSNDEASELNVSNLDKSKYIRLFSGGDVFSNPALIWNPSYNFRFATFDDNTMAFNEYMRISSLGNVGIGTTNPNQKLSIQGKLKIGDDGNTPVEGTIRYDATSDDFEGYDGTSYKSFTSNQIIYNYDTGNSVQSTLRNLGVDLGINVPINESGTYYVGFTARYSGLQGGINTNPYDYGIELNLFRNSGVQKFNILKADNFPDYDQSGSAAYERWYPKKVNHFIIVDLYEGDFLSLEALVATLSNPVPTKQYSLSQIQVFAIKLSD